MTHTERNPTMVQSKDLRGKRVTDDTLVSRPIINVGKQGVVVQGNVEGDVITGDENKIVKE